VALRNAPDAFGLVTRVLHWAMAAGILGMLVLGTTIAWMQPSLSNLWLFALHKTTGLILLALVILRIVWHRISPPPAPLGPPDAWEQRLARATHILIYLLLLAIPISGYVASSASGLDVMLFDRWVIPPIAPVSEAWEDAGWLVHRALTKVLMAVLVLHIAGTLKRQMAGDRTLGRMIKGR
jgi:cytochrome b561